MADTKTAPPPAARPGPDAGPRAALRIGHVRPNYAERRLILGRVADASYVEVPDSSRRDGHVVARLNAIARRELVSPTTIDNLFRAGALPGVGLLHLVNAVAFGPTPWVSTFETVTPRFAGNLIHPAPEPDFTPVARQLLNRAALHAMSRPRCLGLLALSDCARSIEEAFLEPFGRRGDLVRTKLAVLHPPQAANVAEPRAAPSATGPLRLAFVGASFIRKGGRELLQALRHLRETAGLANFHLTIVSSLQVDPYATGETASDMQDVERTIAANPSWITWHRQLPNDEVLALMKDTDLGLLPTHADTYGYTVLEFQSCGVPVLTTDVRAMPEINSDDCGWVLRVAKNRFGEIRRDTAAQRAARAVEIREGLVEVLGEILRRPHALAAKGAAALQRIRTGHDPQAYGERLRAVYDTRLALQR